MTTTVTAKIQVRKGTAAQWTGANPILLAGELGYETDTGKLKIGNGTTAWVTLDYSIDPTVAVVVDHGALTGLADDDHTQYHTDARGDARYALIGHSHSGTYEPDATILKQADVDDTPVNGATTAPVSSNWAYDHAGLATAHGISTFGASLVDDADAGTARTTLGLGTAATQNTTAFEASGTVSTHAALTTTHGISSFGASLVDDADASTARTTLGLGTVATTAATDYATAAHNHSGTYEPADATILKQTDVDDTPVNGVTTAPVSSNWAYDHAALTTAHGISTFGASLVDDADAATARGTLGLGTAATSASGDFAAAAHNHTGTYVPVGADAADLGSGAATDNYVLTADGLGGAAWEAASGGVADGATLSTGLTFPIGGLHILDTNGSHDLIISPGSDLTADRTLTITTGDANRTLTLTADASISGTNTGDQNLSGYATTSHAASHKSAGSDSIKLDELAAPTDVTTLNASSSAHGLLPKLENTGTKFLRDDGTWQTATVSRAELHAVALSF